MSDYERYQYETHFGEVIEVFLMRGRYIDNDNLAIDMMSDEDGYIEPYAHLTVNIDDFDDDYTACIDTNNLGEDIIDWLEENEIAIPLGYSLQSGFCSYPVVAFSAEFVESLPEM